MTDQDAIQRILETCDDESELVVSEAFSDGGTEPLFGRLERAALNQIDEGVAAFSRYGIWANTVRDNIREALRLLDAGESQEATRLLRRCVNVLSAFAEIQAHFDPMEIGHPTIGSSRRDEAGG